MSNLSSNLTAVITAAAPAHRHLLHQTLTTAEGRLATIAQLFTELLAGVAARIVFVVPSGETRRLEESVRAGAGSIVVVEQPEPKGYGDAIYCARPYVAGKPFLHLVGDHFYLPPSAAGTDPKSLLRMLVDLHEAEGTSVSTVHPTPESLLGYFGAVGGKILRSAAPVPIYEVETVLEKPTPTQGEQELVVPGVRSGQYLCFYGLHLFTPALMQVLDESAAAGQPIPTLSVAMQRLVQRERLLAAVLPGRRFDLGRKYGLLQAQLALALSGPDRAEVLALMLEQAAQ